MTTPPPSPPLAPSLVGREHEQAILRDAIDTAFAGHGSTVLIGGEAGIGKTALAEAACMVAADRGALVLVGRCYDLAETPPYGPWVELLGRYRQGEAMPPLPAAFASRGTVGEVTSQIALVQQTLDFFTAVATARPTVILLDDLHWADAGSLDMLRFLARNLAMMPLLLIVTYRSEELTRRHPLHVLLPLIVREAGARRLDVHAIDSDAVRMLIGAYYHMPGGETDQLTAYLQDRAEGNPLFLGELLRALVETGAVQRQGDGWRLGDLREAAVPLLLRQVIDARCARLDDEAQYLLAVAAVIGQEVPLTIWAEAGATDEDSLVSVIEQAEAAHILVETPDGAGVRFVHALIREALYEGISAIRRRRIHRRVGEALAARRHPDPDGVASQFLRAGDKRAVEWLVQAGDRAERAYAWPTAAARFEAALALMEQHTASATERGWLHLRLAVLYSHSDRERAYLHVDTARSLLPATSDPLLDTYILIVGGLFRCFRQDSDRGLPEMEAGIARLEALPDEARYRLRTVPLAIRQQVDGDGVGTLVLRRAIVGHHATARTLGEELIARSPGRTAGGVGDAMRGDAYVGIGIAYAMLGQPHEARRAFTQAVTEHRAEEHHWMVLVSLAMYLSFVQLPYFTDALTDRRRLLEELTEAVPKASGATGSEPTALFRFHASASLLAGEWETMDRVLHHSHHLSEVMREAGFGEVFAQLAEAQGAAPRAWEVIDRGLPDGPATEPGNIPWYAATPLQRVAAILALREGNLSRAKAWIEAHDRWLVWGEAVLGRSEAQALWAQYFRQTGDATRADAHARQALADATAPRQPLALLAAHRLIGELATDAGLFAAAEEHFRASLALVDSCGAPHERALTLLGMAKMHIARDERDASRALLETVQTICEPLGAQPALARAAALLASLDRPQETAAPYSAGLSAREVEVLRLVAQGLTNPAVAEQLFLSPRTVGQHLRSIYNKLDVSSRTAAARVAIERGLL